MSCNPIRQIALENAIAVCQEKYVFDVSAGPHTPRSAIKWDNLLQEMSCIQMR